MLCSTPIFSALSSEKPIDKRFNKLIHKRFERGDLLVEDSAPNQAFDNTIEIDLENRDIIELIPTFMNQGIIPPFVLKQEENEELFIKDITNSKGMGGKNKKRIILIGKKTPDKKKPDKSNSKIIYVLKELRDPNELDGIKSAYQKWNKQQDKTNLNSIINASVRNDRDGTLKNYNLKLAWHERIFHDRNNPGVYYELLHAAQGKIIRSYYELPITKGVNFFDLQTKQLIVEDYNDEQFLSAKRELTEIMRPLDNETYDFLFNKKIMTLEKFNQLLSENKIIVSDLIKYKMEKFLNKYISFKFSNDYVFNISSPDNVDWQEIRTAYEALGAVIGAFFKKYNIDLNTKQFDLHHNNVFFEPKSNTVTLIDLEFLGIHLSDQRTTNVPSTLDEVLGHEYFKKVAPSFDNAMACLFNTADEETKVALQERRNQLLSNIRTLYESFANAFIQNSKEEEISKIQAFFDEKIYELTQ
jgi:hypothetical protein